MTRELRAAFDSDSVPKKNIALRKASDEIERLQRTNEELLSVLKSIERTANQAATMHRAEDPKP